MELNTTNPHWFTAQLILTPKNIATLRNAFEKGIETEISVGGRVIRYKPDLAGSGFSFFGEKTFYVGREAFINHSELGKTILHELYRLSESTIPKIGLGFGQTTLETNATANFANRAIGFLNY